LSGIAIAQTQSAPRQSPLPNQAGRFTRRGSSTVLPTEETVNSFLFQMFGYDPTKTWKVVDIRPSEVPGLAEVSVVITTRRARTRIGCWSAPMASMRLTGDILPFGAKPFDEARAKLEKGVNGPAKGPAKGRGDDCRIQRYAVPALCQGRARN
jgi:hypothetical protein